MVLKLTQLPHHLTVLNGFADRLPGSASKCSIQAALQSPALCECIGANHAFNHCVGRPKRC